MNILLVINDIFFENLKFYYFNSSKESTHELMKNLNSNDYYIKTETISKINKIINENKEFIEVTPPIGGLFIDVIYGMTIL